MTWTPDNYTHNASGHMVRQQAARERRGEMTIFDAIYNCYTCDKPVEDYEPIICCSGLREECYCMGQPVNGYPFCSSECEQAYANRAPVVDGSFVLERTPGRGGRGE